MAAVDASMGLQLCPGHFQQQFERVEQARRCTATMLKRLEVEVEVGNGREGWWPGGRGDRQVLARAPPAALVLACPRPTLS